jgi:hypothetical protein
VPPPAKSAISHQKVPNVTCLTAQTPTNTLASFPPSQKGSSVLHSLAPNTPGKRRPPKKKKKKRKRNGEDEEHTQLLLPSQNLPPPFVIRMIMLLVCSRRAACRMRAPFIFV